MTTVTINDHPALPAGNRAMTSCQRMSLRFVPLRRRPKLPRYRVQIAPVTLPLY